MHSRENVFYPLYELILEVSKNFKPPKCSLRPFELTEICTEETTNCRPVSTKPEAKSEEPVVFADVYRYRSSKKERAFVPPTASENSQISQASSSDFIALGDDVSFVENKKQSAHKLKNKRYVDIYEEKQNKETVEKSDIIERDNDKVFSESELIDKSNDSVKEREDRKNYKRKRKMKVEYLPLKIKCIQGNSNRTKATKFAKKKM